MAIRQNPEFSGSVPVVSVNGLSDGYRVISTPQPMKTCAVNLFYQCIPRLCSYSATRRGAASPRDRNRAKITVLLCKQKPYPVWFSCQFKSYLGQCEHIALNSPLPSSPPPTIVLHFLRPDTCQLRMLFSLCIHVSVKWTNVLINNYSSSLNGQQPMSPKAENPTSWSKISRQNNCSQLTLDCNPFLPPKSRRFSLLVGYIAQQQLNQSERSIDNRPLVGFY